VHVYKHWINLDDKPKRLEKTGTRLCKARGQKTKRSKQQNSTHSSFRRGSEMVFCFFFPLTFFNTTNLKFKEGKTFSSPLPVS
jgi:predicted membrane metal-binding protein